jgi:hypothetical protein
MVSSQHTDRFQAVGFRFITIIILEYNCGDRARQVIRALPTSFSTNNKVAWV